jgi:hypothetical protein
MKTTSTKISIADTQKSTFSRRDAAKHHELHMNHHDSMIRHHDSEDNEKHKDSLAADAAHQAAYAAHESAKNALEFYAKDYNTFRRKAADATIAATVASHKANSPD